VKSRPGKQQRPRSNGLAGTDLPDLFASEASDRMLNELAGAAKTLRRARRPYGDPGALSVLAHVCEGLQAHAELHQLLSPPGLLRPADLPCDPEELCEALFRAVLAPAGIRLRLTLEAVPLTIAQAWMLNLVVSELVTCAARHAFDDSGGTMHVQITAAEGFAICRVDDDGRAVSGTMPEAQPLLAAVLNELHGEWLLRTTSEGASAIVTFPLLPLLLVGSGEE